MLSTTTYDYGDVVLVGFPFTNLQATKKRPAVIISHQHYQQTRPDVIATDRESLGKVIRTILGGF